MKKQESKIKPVRDNVSNGLNKVRKVRDRGIVLFYILLIYISLPAMPGLWERFAQKVGNFADYFAASILGLIGLFIIFYLISKRKDIRNFIWLAVLAFAYAIGLNNLELSIERIHFIEYGLLSLFVFRALRHNIRNKSLYLWSGITVFCLGFLDEGIQYVLPNRVYDTRDVIVNGIAGILGLFIIGLCFQPIAGQSNGAPKGRNNLKRGDCFLGLRPPRNDGGESFPK